MIHIRTKQLLIAAAVAVTLVLIGLWGKGRWDDSRLNSVKPGMTESEVLALLGSPDEVKKGELASRFCTAAQPTLEPVYRSWVYRRPLAGPYPLYLTIDQSGQVICVARPMEIRMTEF
jgi:hypothetical protein